MIYFFIIFVILLISITLYIIDAEEINVNSNNQEFSCNTADECMELHLNNTYLHNMLEQRCNLDILSNTNNHNLPNNGIINPTSIHTNTKQHIKDRRITFIHLPKTGGSSVRDFLHIHAKHRSRSNGHEHFILSSYQEPNNIFATMLRNPLTRAVSFYSYVNEIPILSKDAILNPLWVNTYKIDPIEWSKSEFIQQTLYTDPLGFFLSNITNITNSITRYNYTIIQKITKPILKTLINGNYNDYIKYIDTMPKQYQCKQHLELNFIFIKHFEIIGILENTIDFYKIFLKRTNLSNNLIKTAIKIHENPSIIKITLNEKERMMENLRNSLFCPILLWKLADLINQADMKCL